MEEVLAVYLRPHDPERPLVCLDETSKQLVAETRTPIPMKPGSPAHYDYEYERHGVANLFMMFAPLEGWRHVKVTDRHTAIDYAHVLRDISDIHFADAEELWPKFGDGLNRGRRHIMGVFEPPLLHRRSDMPCLKITSLN
jgi:hypothetical protein